MADLPNVLLVTVDSLRADHVYGDAANTPAFDALADVGTTYEEAIAQGPYTTFSMPSLFTSRYPSQLTSIDFVEGVEGVLVEGVPTVQQHLADEGYTTAGIHTNPLLSELFGFDVGFDHFDDGLGGLSDRLPERLALLADKVGRLVRRYPYVPADRLTDRAIDWLQRNDEEPFFLWVHYMDVHGPYQSRDGFQYLEKYRAEALWRKAVHSPEEVTDTERRRLQETYVEEVEVTDHAVSRLREAFDNVVDDRDSMTVLTADHGDEFDEHGAYSHENKLYDELIHVPLIVDAPESIRPLERDPETVVPLLDVGPTILDAAEVETEDFVGTSLFEEAVADEGPSRSVTVGDAKTPAVLSEARLEPAYVGAVRTSRWKFIEDEGSPELYDLSEDPAETENVVKARPDVAEQLERVLTAHRERRSGQQRGEEHLDSDELDEQLRSLGYLE